MRILYVVSEVVPNMVSKRVAQDVQVAVAVGMRYEGVSSCFEQLERCNFIAVLEGGGWGITKD